MKKHDILFQAQEEAFIQALEEEMARETPDPNAIRAILDQLDRQTGGAAFDPEAGWRELQTRPAGQTAPAGPLPRGFGRCSGVPGGGGDGAGGESGAP